MRLKALHHVVFAVTDLAETERFASDFGLETVSNDGRRLYMRTCGGDAYSYVAEQAAQRAFLGLAFLAEDTGVLEEAIEQHGASAVRQLDGPAGGQAVTLISPEGIRVDIVAGIAEASPAEPHPHLMTNAPGAVSRYKDPQHGRPLGPAKLFRLGHIGLYVKDYAGSAQWLQEVLGLKISDTMYMGEPDKRMVGFFRLDRGAEWVDHHTVFIAQFGKTDCHHISFEVQDYEAQFRAHRWLEKQGWKPNWGVGRHPLGSHIFDVWFDPDNYRFETFSDTDLVNAEHQAGNHDVHHSEMDLWSSESPERYFA